MKLRVPSVIVGVADSRSALFTTEERIGLWRDYVIAGSDEILMRKTIGPLRTFRR